MLSFVQLCFFATGTDFFYPGVTVPLGIVCCYPEQNDNDDDDDDRREN